MCVTNVTPSIPASRKCWIRPAEWINFAENTACNFSRVIPAQFNKSACFWRFFVLSILFPVILLCTSELAADSCIPSHEYHEFKRVEHIIDGDTIILEDGRHVRLIGVNTPEIDHENNTAEPGGYQARDYLSRLLANQAGVYLYFDTERYDKYRRTLAHLFLQDGTNIQQHLLEKGLAIPLVYPPNLAFIDCYQQSSQSAYRHRTGLWNNHNFRIIGTDEINPVYHNRHVFISGKVTKILKTDTSTWIVLDHNVKLQIKKNEMPYFNHIKLSGLVGEKITAYGWLYKRNNNYQMRIRHPAILNMIR